MTLAQTMPDGAVLVAIDVAKHRNEILIEAPGRTRRRRLMVLNTRTEHDRFVETLGGYDAPVVAGFEGEAQPNGTTTGRSRTGCCRPEWGSG